MIPLVIQDVNPTKEFLTVKLKQLRVCLLPIIFGNSPVWQINANVLHITNCQHKTLVAIAI